MLDPKGVRAPCGGDAHVGERDVVVFVKEGKQPLFPQGGGGDLPEPEMADSKHESSAIEREAGCNVPVGVLVPARDGGLGSENAVPDAGMVSAGVSEGKNGLTPG